MLLFTCCSISYSSFDQSSNSSPETNNQPARPNKPKSQSSEDLLHEFGRVFVPASNWNPLFLNLSLCWIPFCSCRCTNFSALAAANLKHNQGIFIPGVMWVGVCPEVYFPTSSSCSKALLYGFRTICKNLYQLIMKSMWKLVLIIALLAQLLHLRIQRDQSLSR
jgi:hypothetical protein